VHESGDVDAVGQDDCRLREHLCEIDWDVSNPVCSRAMENSMAARMWIGMAQAGFSLDPTVATCRASVGEFRRRAIEWKRAKCFTFENSRCESRFWREVRLCTGCNAHLMQPWHCEGILHDFCDVSAPSVSEEFER
jgi:hypothetical protein